MGSNQNKVNKAADLVKNAVLDLNETEIMMVLKMSYFNVDLFGATRRKVANIGLKFPKISVKL